MTGRTGDPRVIHTRVIHQVASVLLGYPDERLYDARPVLTGAVAGLPAGQAAKRLAVFLAHLDRTPLAEAAAHYVEVFDLKRRCCPYLTYFTYGDTRKRGMALLRFKHAYRLAGFEIDGDELPDHLAVVCELSGRGATREAVRLLREHRPGVELLLRALEAEGSPYADVVAAVLATLPELGPRDRAALLKLATEGPPPAEDVGLEPYDLAAMGGSMGGNR
ncbi:MAG TPA: nitrate reductase molybdenum cofactor assembly chaperone [Thermopolyspora sp.]